jgi:hypothetical protein
VFEKMNYLQFRYINVIDKVYAIVNYFLIKV